MKAVVETIKQQAKRVLQTVYNLILKISIMNDLKKVKVNEDCTYFTILRS